MLLKKLYKNWRGRDSLCLPQHYSSKGFAFVDGFYGVSKMSSPFTEIEVFVFIVKKKFFFLVAFFIVDCIFTLCHPMQNFVPVDNFNTNNKNDSLNKLIIAKKSR